MLCGAGRRAGTTFFPWAFSGFSARPRVCRFAPGAAHPRPGQSVPVGLEGVQRSSPPFLFGAVRPGRPPLRPAADRGRRAVLEGNFHHPRPKTTCTLCALGVLRALGCVAMETGRSTLVQLGSALCLTLEFVRLLWSPGGSDQRRPRPDSLAG